MVSRMSLVVALAFGSLFCSNAFAEPPRDFTGYSVIQVTVNSQYELEYLTEHVESVWTDYPNLGAVPVLVSPDQRRALDKEGYSYEVQIEDVQPLFDRQKAEGGRSDWDHYMNLSEINAYINNLAATRPDLCDVFSIGRSIENREMWVLHITGTPAGNKPAVFYESLIHAREWIAGPCSLYLANYLVGNYDTDPAVRNLVDKLDIYILPCVNPDGYEYTWTTNRDWRKNRRNNGDGSYGVDLNRNWGYGWGGGGSSGTPSSNTYRGTAPFSEPENAAIRDYLIAHPNVVAHMDYHSYGQHILWPFGAECVGGPPDPDGPIFQALGSTMSSLIQSVSGKYYDYGPICETLYQASGGLSDWIYAEEGIIGFVIELRDTGTYGFTLPPDQILPTVQENLPAILHLTEWAVAQIGTHLSLATSLPEIIPPGTPMTIGISVDSIGENIIPGSPTLHYRFDGGAFLTSTLVDVGGGVYEGTLPAAHCDDTPEFYFSAEGESSGVVVLPAGAPTEVFTIPVGELVISFEDNFNQDLGWSVVNDANLTDGPWERGIPVTSCDRGNPLTDFDGSGWCFLTDNAAQADCNTDVDGGTTWLISPTIDLSDGDATIQYALWYTNNFGGDPNNDLFKVYVSNNNGADWTVAAIIGPQSLSGWNMFSFNVADFVTPTDAVKVRFEASDLGTGSVVEAAVDAFRVLRVECHEQGCPGDLDGDGDVDISDLAQLLANYGMTSGASYEQGDLDGDGDVDISDLAALLAVYNTIC